MAVMKFLCDTKRCIECNGCVTACKNENDSALEWGIQRRRVVTINDGQPGEASISVACMHCTDAPCQAVCPANCFYKTEDGLTLHTALRIKRQETKVLLLGELERLVRHVTRFLLLTGPQHHAGNDAHTKSNDAGMRQPGHHPFISIWPVLRHRYLLNSFPLTAGTAAHPSQVNIRKG